MKIIKEIKSISNNKDCFGNVGPFSTDHVYPLAKGGSNVKKNKIELSTITNLIKKDKTKGKINKEWKFAVLQQKDSDGRIFGLLYIRNVKWKPDEWAKVI